MGAPKAPGGPVSGEGGERSPPNAAARARPGPPRGIVALMGSGELTSTMVEVHKALLTRLGPSPRAVFLDTPAGFQLNADQISARAVEYFRRRVGHDLAVASFKSARATPAGVAEQAFHLLRSADYILIGPGSPTYAVRQWKGTPIPDILVRRVAGGACLVAASAAALTVGRFTLPVYEIYKVGEDLHWVEGVDVLGRLGLDLVVIPHWNNAEGGTHDTRFCYMGEPRFRELEGMLPEGLGILGLDEHTACVLDLDAGEAVVRGIGGVTLRRGGTEARFGRGARIPLEVLRGEAGGGGSPPVPGFAGAGPGPRQEDPFWPRVHALEAGLRQSLDRGDPAGAANALLELDRLVWQARQDLQDEAAIAEAREVLREMIVMLGTRLGPRSDDRERFRALVEALVELRARWRAERRWDEADALRACLERAGVVVEDTKEGTRWRLARR